LIKALGKAIGMIDGGPLTAFEIEIFGLVRTV
jgi:hypothetical protein